MVFLSSADEDEASAKRPQKGWSNPVNYSWEGKLPQLPIRIYSLVRVTSLTVCCPAELSARAVLIWIAVSDCGPTRKVPYPTCLETEPYTRPD
jgi:hypothetical protein